MGAQRVDDLERQQLGQLTQMPGAKRPAATVTAKATNPRLTIHIAEVGTADGFGLLLADDADIAVIVPTPQTPPRRSGDLRFDQQPLLEEPQDLLVPADHPFARHEAVTLAAAREPWVVAAPGSSDHHQLVLVACSAAGFAPDTVHHAKEWIAVSALVAYGFGVSLIPRLAPIPPQYPAVRIP